MKTVVVMAAACCLLGAAHAGWKVDAIKDRLADQSVKQATATAKSDDDGVTARLHVYCLGMRGDTSPVVSLETNSSFAPGRMGLRYRLDNDEPEPRYMPVNSSGNGMSLWAQPKTFFGKKRLRIELQPHRSRNLFFEFDITSAEQAIRGLGCRRLDPHDE
jgi:hypothetical protein